MVKRKSGDGSGAAWRDGARTRDYKYWKSTIRGPSESRKAHCPPGSRGGRKREITAPRGRHEHQSQILNTESAPATPWAAALATAYPLEGWVLHSSTFTPTARPTSVHLAFLLANICLIPKMLFWFITFSFAKLRVLQSDTNVEVFNTTLITILFCQFQG